MSRWIYTGTVCSWIYSRPRAESRAICTRVDHGSGSLPGMNMTILLSYHNRNTLSQKKKGTKCWSNLNDADVHLSYHSQWIHKQGKESSQHNIQLSEPAWTLKHRYNIKLIKIVTWKSPLHSPYYSNMFSRNSAHNSFFQQYILGVDKFKTSYKHELWGNTISYTYQTTDTSAMVTNKLRVTREVINEI